jgi:hypothetical protein
MLLVMYVQWPPMVRVIGSLEGAGPWMRVVLLMASSPILLTTGKHGALPVYQQVYLATVYAIVWLRTVRVIGSLEGKGPWMVKLLA